jgi:hypothetical protein
LRRFRGNARRPIAHLNDRLSRISRARSGILLQSTRIDVDDYLVPIARGAAVQTARQRTLSNASQRIGAALSGCRVAGRLSGIGGLR